MPHEILSNEIELMKQRPTAKNKFVDTIPLPVTPREPPKSAAPGARRPKVMRIE